MKIWQIKTIVATVAAVVLFVLLMIIILWEQGIIKPTTDSGDLSQFLDLTEDEFLELFHLPQIKDPKEKMKRVRALKEHQQAVLENNKSLWATFVKYLDISVLFVKYNDPATNSLLAIQKKILSKHPDSSDAVPYLSLFVYVLKLCFLNLSSAVSIKRQ